MQERRSRVVRGWATLGLGLILMVAAAAQEPTGPDPVREGWIRDLARLRGEHRDDRAVKHRVRPPEGWQRKASGRLVFFLSVAAEDARLYTPLIGIARKLAGWLEDDLGGPWSEGPDTMTLRLCAREDERSAFTAAPALTWDWDAQETIIVVGRGGSYRIAMQDVGEGLTRQYLDRRCPGLWNALPQWLEWGLRNLVRASRDSKAKGFVFLAPDESWRSVMELSGNGGLIPLRALVSSPPDEVIADGPWTTDHVRQTAEVFLNFLTQGRGRKGRTKDLIARYLGGLAADLRTIETDVWCQALERLEARRSPLAPEALGDVFRLHEAGIRQSRFHPPERRASLLHAGFQAACGDWKDGDWKKLDQAFLAHVKKGWR